MSSTIDLDALVPQPVTIHINNKDIQVQPPSTLNVFRLGSLGQKMQNADQLTTEEMSKLVEGITSEVRACIPELENYNLNTAQLLKLVQIISEMGTPTEAKELEARGIKPSAPKAE
jgi:hypothetical protein